jgi:acyl transferase domain-containing protein/aryl carrier-like protein
LSGSGIAIVGMSCRFPGAADVEQFWRNLRDGVEAIARLTDDDLREAGIGPELAASPAYVRAASYVDGIERFDADFFGVNPREAEVLDPQQRLFLECAWEAFESAGYDCRSFPGRIGVYAGARISDYFLYNLLSNAEIIDTVGRLQILFGNDKDYLATFTSFKLNLRGPSLSVQTACSSALVAVHLASESLLSGECDMAVAGGVSVRLPARAGYVHQPGGLLSPDGHCRSFDARAAGTVFGAGAGAVVLRRLEDALAAGDPIRAVLRGSAVNNDGALKVGFSAPSEDGQAGVIAEALAVAGVEPGEISYVEAHGSGTPIGDPIEVAALTRAFREGTDRRGFCALGSVKSSVGHLEAAAGAAGLIKTVLALENGIVPASLHFETPNPQIDFASSPFFVNTAARPWEPGDGGRRLAGVSSFGLGGTNCHAILEEAPAAAPSGPSRPWQLLLLSARTAPALRAANDRLLGHLRRHPGQSLPDVAFTCQAGRQSFEHRQMMLCRDLDDAAKGLETQDPARVFTGVEESRDRPVAFLFPGLGEHYAGMAGELYLTEPVFREEIDRAAVLLSPRLGLDLVQVLFPEGAPASGPAPGAPGEGFDLRRLLGRGGGGPAVEGPLRRTAVAQPAVFAVEYALARLWMSWGVRPQAVLGYSLGEYVAACLAGVMSFADALALVADRARLIEELPAGAMLAVPLSEDEFAARLTPGLAIAAVNGPADCVASGPVGEIEELERRLAGEEVACRRLETSHAFHSAMMAPMVDRFLERIRAVELRPPQIPYVSNVTGTWIRGDEATDPGYWVRHLCGTVRFGDGLGALLADPDRLLLEVGPGQSLATTARRHPQRTAGHLVLTSVRHRDQAQSDQAFLLTTLGRLWLGGVRIDWTGFHSGERRRRLPLPTYPFERRRFWVEPRPLGATAPRPAAAGKLPDLADWFHVPVWKQVPAVAMAGGRALTGSRWLVLAHPGSLGDAVLERLRAARADTVAAAPGVGFRRLGESTYELDPGKTEDYDALLGELGVTGGLPGRILHLWSVADSATAGSPHQPAALGFASLLALAQALGRRSLSEPVELLVAANGLADLTGEEVEPEKCLLLGPSRVIPQEYAGIRCRAVDVVPPVPGSAGERRLAAELLELALAEDSPALLALRGGHRWVQDFEPVRLAGDPAQPGLRRHGVYLITGGLGGLGLALAEHLARTVAARLILVGRSTPSEGVQARLQVLERLGAEVMVAQADVARPEQMGPVLRQARTRFGALHGVFHAAGVPGGGVVQLQTAERVASVLAPKVEGARVLAELLAGEAPDFVALFSSTLSLLGGSGQAAYCAANAFLDGFARSLRAHTGIPAVAVDWDRWLEVGMVARDAGDLGIRPQEGTECLARILAHPELVQVVVSVRPFREVAAAARPAEPATPPAALSARHPRPALQRPYVPPQSDLELQLAGLWQDLLGIERVGIHDSFFELGGDSLRGIQLAALARQAGLSLTTADLFEGPTVAQLAVALSSGLPAREDVQEPEPQPDTPQFPGVSLSPQELDQLVAAFGEDRR